MTCGCVQTCSCAVQAGVLLTITGTGDFTDPWLFNVLETVFNPVGINGILITPSDPSDPSYGHEPTFEILIDETGTAPVTVGPNGLKVDCCPVDAGDVFTVDDTDTVDLTLAGSVLSADVVLDPDPCNVLESSASGLFAQSGVAIFELGDGTSVNINTTPGGDSGASFRACITNTNPFPIYVTVEGQAIVNAEIVSAAANVNIDLACRLELEAGGDQTVFVGGGASRSVRVNEMTNTGSLNPFPGSEGITSADILHGTFYLDPGDNAQIYSYTNTTNFDNLDGTVAGGNGYQFIRVTAKVERVDFCLDLGVASGVCP